MGVHSFRLTPTEERRLRALGVRPSARAKELLEEDLRRREALEDSEWLARHAIKPRVPIERLIREIRDEY